MHAHQASCGRDPGRLKRVIIGVVPRRGRYGVWHASNHLTPHQNKMVKHAEMEMVEMMEKLEYRASGPCFFALIKVGL